MSVAQTSAKFNSVEISRNAMKTAWAFIRKGLYKSFAEALRKAWKVVKAFSRKVVKFVKVSTGEVRTLKFARLNEFTGYKYENSELSDKGLIRVLDTDILRQTGDLDGSIRAFYINSII